MPYFACVGNYTRVNVRNMALMDCPSQACMLALHRAAEDNDMTPRSRAQELWANASVSPLIGGLVVRCRNRPPCCAQLNRPFCETGTKTCCTQMTSTPQRFLTPKTALWTPGCRSLAAFKTRSASSRREWCVLVMRIFPRSNACRLRVYPWTLSGAQFIIGAAVCFGGRGLRVGRERGGLGAPV